jgi:hypothetical protein
MERGAAMMRAFALVLCLAAAPSEASCVSNTRCLCLDPATILDARVQSIDGARTTLQVVAVRSRIDGGNPSVVSMPRLSSDNVGRQTLVFVGSDGEIYERKNTTDAGTIDCPGGSGVVALPASDAIDIALAADCDDRLRARGLTQGECHDSGCTCDSSSALGVLAAACMTRFFARRRRLPR